LAASVHELAADQARANAETFLRSEYGLPIRITSFGSDVRKSLWPDGRFDWETFITRDFGPVTLQIAVWVDAELEVLGLCTAHGPQVIPRFVEGRPSGHPALRGQRLWMILEVAANFATALSKSEIWWHPETNEFLRFCVETIRADRIGQQCRLSIPS
jgi:hypothetical protein